MWGKGDVYTKTQWHSGNDINIAINAEFESPIPSVTRNSELCT